MGAAVKMLLVMWSYEGSGGEGGCLPVLTKLPIFTGKILNFLVCTGEVN